MRLAYLLLVTYQVVKQSISIKRKVRMKVSKLLGLVVALGFSMMGTTGLAQSNPPPVVVDPGKDNVSAQLKEIKDLAQTFESKRHAYVAQQQILLANLKNANTPAQRKALRDELETNRAAFFAELKAYREEIRQELAEIKTLVHNAEYQRILAEVKAAAGGHGGKAPH
jgi:hypothetical protein